MANSRYVAGFTKGEKVIWLCPNTASRYATFEAQTVMLNGEVWAKITTMPGLGNDPVMNFVVPYDQLVPAF